MLERDDMGRLARLLATRDSLAAAIAKCEAARDLPALCREYRLLLAEIDAVDVREETDVVDQLAARRGAKDSGRAAGGA